MAAANIVLASRGLHYTAGIIGRVGLGWDESWVGHECVVEFGSLVFVALFDKVRVPRLECLVLVNEDQKRN